MFGVVVSRMAKVFEPDVAAGGADPERAAVDVANTTPENAGGEPSATSTRSGRIASSGAATRCGRSRRTPVRSRT